MLLYVLRRTIRTGIDINHIATGLVVDYVPGQPRINPLHENGDEERCDSLFYMNVLQCLVGNSDTDIERVFDVADGRDGRIVGLDRLGSEQRFVDVLFALVFRNGGLAAQIGIEIVSHIAAARPDGVLV